MILLSHLHVGLLCNLWNYLGFWEYTMSSITPYIKNEYNASFICEHTILSSYSELEKENP